MNRFFPALLLCLSLLFASPSAALPDDPGGASRETAVEYLETTGMYKVALYQKLAAGEATRLALREFVQNRNKPLDALWSKVVEETMEDIQRGAHETFLAIRLNRQSLEEIKKRPPKNPLGEQFLKEYEEDKEAYFEAVIPVIRKNYSEDELRRLIEIFKTGRKINPEVDCLEDQVASFQAAAKSGTELTRRAFADMELKREKKLRGIGAYPDVIAEENPAERNRQYDRSKKLLSKALTDGAELFLVSGYETPDRDKDTRVTVKVDHPGKPVILVLTSFYPVAWRLDVAGGTRLEAVIVSTVNRSSTVAADPGTPVFQAKLGYASRESREFVEIVKTLKAWFGAEKVDGFRGEYTIPNEIAIDSDDPPGAPLTLDGTPVTPPSRNLEFPFLDREGNVFRLPLTGPKGEVKLPAGDRRKSLSAVSGDGKRLYTFDGTMLRVRNADGSGERNFPVPEGFPEFSWVLGMVYDTRHDIVMLLESHVDSHIYRFDAAGGRWLDYRKFEFGSIGNQILAAAYDRDTGRTLVLTHGMALLIYSEQLEAVRAFSLEGKLPGIERIYDPGNGPPPPIFISALGNDVALAAASDSLGPARMSRNDGYVAGEEPGRILRIWHLDLATDKVELTYKAATE